LEGIFTSSVGRGQLGSRNQAKMLCFGELGFRILQILQGQKTNGSCFAEHLGRGFYFSAPSQPIPTKDQKNKTGKICTQPSHITFWCIIKVFFFVTIGQHKLLWSNIKCFMSSLFFFFFATAPTPTPLLIDNFKCCYFSFKQTKKIP
jgi:hypothetical protein